MILMTKNLLTIIFCAVSNLVIAQPYGTTFSSKVDSTAVLKTRNTIKSLMDKTNIPGLSIAVGKDNQIIYSEGFGVSDIENGELMHQSTKLRIGSISKSLTAALMMKMHEDKLIEINTPIKSYLKSIPKSYTDITPRQLAGHLGGVRHYKKGEYFRTEQYKNVKESLEIFLDDTLLYEPGTKYSYSTYGYVLLSAVLEEAANEPFLHFMRSNLFDPLSMNSTVAEFADSIIYNRAEFYENKDGTLLNAPSENYSYKWAGGGYLSTSKDLANFAMNLMNGSYLKKENVNLMFQSQTTAIGEKTKYGIGWEIGEDWEERSIVMHGGSSMGARAFMLLYPEHNLVIIMLSNKGRAPIFQAEAALIADYFLSVDNSLNLEQEIEGSYQYQRIVDGKEQEGILTLIKNGDSYNGMISNLYSSIAPITNVQINKENVVISVVTPSGIANLWLQFDNNGFKGQYGWDSPSKEILGNKMYPK